jgi:hypothetical protein
MLPEGFKPKHLPKPPVNPTRRTVSYVETEEYKRLYSEYLDLLVQLHNYHYSFLNGGAKVDGARFRTTLNEIQKLTKPLKEASRRAKKELVINEELILREHNRQDKKAKRLQKTLTIKAIKEELKKQQKQNT